MVQLLDEVVVASVDQDVAMLMHGDGGTLAYGRGWSDSDEEVDEAGGGQAEEAGAELPGSKPAAKKKRVAAAAAKGKRTAGAKKPKAKKHKPAGKKG